MIVDRRKSLFRAGICVGIIALVIFYFAVDPAWRFMPRCPVYALTGLRCPGCGTQRALHALLHGDLGAAWGFNPALLISIPLMTLIGVSVALKSRLRRLYLILHSPPVIIAVGVLLLGWGIFRNLSL